MEKNKQQTAVELIINQLRQLAHNPSTHLGMGDVRVTQGMIDELEEQAKQIEKDQIIEAYKREAAYMKHAGCTDQMIDKSSIKYYNETYGKE